MYEYMCSMLTFTCMDEVPNLVFSMKTFIIRLRYPICSHRCIKFTDLKAMGYYTASE